jgi:glycosyltransferase involved in cell wall biosynthesis
MTGGAVRWVRANSPIVSVVLPTFDRLKYLRAAVDSVFSQTFADWELVIADDGSGLETRAYLEALEDDPRVGVLRLRHTGNPSAVRNAALREARGQYLAFLDSDDVWLPTKLAVQVAALRGNPLRRWSYTAITRVGPDGTILPNDANRRWVPYEGPIFEQLLTLQAAVATPSVVAERTLVEQAGAFDEGQPFFEEYDLWLRLIRLSEVSVIREPLVLVRNHDEHYTVDRVGVYEARARLLDKVGGGVTTASLRSALRAERAKNAVALATAYVRRERRTEALETLWRNRVHLWHCPRHTWRPAAATMTRVITPRWLQRFARLHGPGRGAVVRA